ncbi:MAG: NAD(P)/FAD-dependent oxidoreductase, partial [Armatimonadota bacterium]
MKKYDTIIIGGGPAGLSAGIYAMRSRLNTVLAEKFMPGGQMMITDFVENYPGFPGIGGPDLSAAMEKHARSLDLEILSTEVLSLDLSVTEKIVSTADGELSAPTVILAVGATPRFLGVPGEAHFIGRGVSTCATCDAAFFRDKEVAVVGGGNTAVQDSLFLTRFASKVTIIHRRDALRAAKILQERALKNPKIQIEWNSVVAEVQGDTKVQGVVVENVLDGARRT